MQATLEPPDLLDDADLCCAVRQQMELLPPVIRPTDLRDHDELLTAEYEPKPASQPTDAQPGSHEKIELLRQRVANGEHLWHPLDRTQYSRDIRQDCTRLWELVT